MRHSTSLYHSLEFAVIVLYKPLMFWNYMCESPHLANSVVNFFINIKTSITLMLGKFWMTVLHSQPLNYPYLMWDTKLTFPSLFSKYSILEFTNGIYKIFNCYYWMIYINFIEYSYIMLETSYLHAHVCSRNAGIIQFKKN